MLVTESRPRTLKWIHAGPLLYGDWGTSRLYVLGLAFFFTGAESFFYLVAIALLMGAVAWAYTIVCRQYPDGGGVYTAARQISPILSVVGATLLLCGYIITAAISVVEAMHHFGVHDGPLLVGLCVLTILFVGGVNWLGAKSAGRFALVIAFSALAVSGVMAVLVLPYIPKGLENITFDTSRSTWAHWSDFTRICLALAGVEAVANMTGLMKKPVAKTAKRTLLPVLAEVALLNLVFAVAMTGLFATLPGLNGIQTTLHEAETAHKAGEIVLAEETLEQITDIKNTAMEVIATEAATNSLGPAVGGVFGKVAAIVFGLLLLSAANTAVMAMVSVLFAMAQDRELPKGLTKLNYSGVPWVALIASCVVSILVIAIERRPEKLAELYIIGVCGAITVTVLSCSLNKKLAISRVERTGLTLLGVFLLAVSCTILVERTNATIFAGTVIGLVLALRFGLSAITSRQPEPLLEPTSGWLAEVRREPAPIDPSKPKIMLAARGRYQAEFAVDQARRRGATLFAIYVRTLRVMDVQPGRVPQIAEDPDAQESLGTTALLARQHGVPYIPIYVTSAEIADEILDYTVTYGCDTLIMGESRRSRVARRLEGDVVSTVAQALPDGIALITRSPDTPHVGLPVTAPVPEPEAGPTPGAQPDSGPDAHEDNGRDAQPPTG